MASNLNDIKVFCRVVETGSFTAAAKQLGSPNSSVSRRVSRLEKDVGVRLLHRTTRKLSLTDLGEMYYERSMRVLAELEDAENQLAASQRTPRGRVRLLVPVEHGMSMAIVNEFLREFPEIRVDMLFSSHELNIIQEGFDASIHVGPVTNMSVVAHTLMNSPFQLVASPGYVERVGAPKRIEELSEHECLIFGPSSSNASWRLMRAGNQEVQVPVRGRLAVNHMQAIRDAALAGLGIALLPKIVCRGDLAQGALVSVLPQVTAPAIPISITYPAGRFLPPSVRAFVEYARNFFGDVAKELEIEDD